MNTLRTRCAAVLLAVPLVLTGCSSDDDVDVDTPAVDVTPGAADRPGSDVDRGDIEDLDDEQGDVGTAESPAESPAG